MIHLNFNTNTHHPEPACGIAQRGDKFIFADKNDQRDIAEQVEMFESDLCESCKGMAV